MGHPDNGTILALIEGEVPEPEAVELQAHLKDCGTCKAVEEELRQATRSLTQGLANLDVDPDLPRARAAILNPTRIKGLPSSSGPPGQSRRSRVFGIRWSLPKAASVAVFLTAGAAAALPGSPVRQWISDWQNDGPAAVQPADPTDLSGQEGEGLQEPVGPAAGARAHEGAIAIWIHDLPDDAELRVRWIDGEEAWIHAGEGTRFTSGEGRLEAFGPPGTVLVDIPRSLERIDVRLNGSALIRKRGGELEILEPVHRRTPSEILFGSQVGTNEGAS